MGSWRGWGLIGRGVIDQDMHELPWRGMSGWMNISFSFLGGSESGGWVRGLWS